MALVEEEVSRAGCRGHRRWADNSPHVPGLYQL